MKATSRSRRTRTLLFLLGAGLVAALALAGALAGGGDSAGVWAQGASNAIAVDAIPGGGVDASIAPGTATFDVDVVIVHTTAPYAGYGSVLQFDANILAVDGHSYLAAGVFDLCASALITTGSVKSGCALSGGTTTFAGATDRITFHCVGQGVSPLHMAGSTVTSDNRTVNNTTTLGPGGTIISTSLVDAQVTCGGGVPPPTPTIGAGPRATPTPLPPGMEAVPLAAGCNPVTVTYPDATPVQTIAGAVGPAGSLVSLWAFDVGNWRAFSPQYPQASDLTAVNLLDVLFVCVGEAGDFVRPVV